MFFYDQMKIIIWIRYHTTHVLPDFCVIISLFVIIILAPLSKASRKRSSLEALLRGAK